MPIKHNKPAQPPPMPTLTIPIKPTLSKYTPDRVEKILMALRAGNARGVSARIGGVEPKTFYNWCQAYPEFLAAVEEAEAAVEAQSLGIILKAGEKHWTARAWFLERKYPERWGRVDRVEVLQVQEQAKALVEELKSEGIGDVSYQDIINERDALLKHKALPESKKTN